MKYCVIRIFCEILCSTIFDGPKYRWMHFIEKFDGENINGQHLRPPVLAILLETIERENFDGLLQIH